MALDLSGFCDDIKEYDTFRYMGKIEKIVGMTIEASGPACNIGDVCRIYSKDMRSFIRAEVVGFNKSNILLMPYTEIEGIGPGSIVDSTGDKLTVKAGAGLIGRIVDAAGMPLDGGEDPGCTDSISITGAPSNPFNRPPIKSQIELGVKAIDGLLTMGKGQRMGIFAGSGVGKSTLMGTAVFQRALASSSAPASALVTASSILSSACRRNVPFRKSSETRGSLASPPAATA